MIHSAKEAREIITHFPDIPERDDELSYREAIGGLNALQWPEVKALWEASKKFTSKAHYNDQLLKGDFKNCCGFCGGRWPCEAKILFDALAQYREAIKP